MAGWAARGVGAVIVFAATLIPSACGGIARGENTTEPDGSRAMVDDAASETHDTSTVDTTDGTSNAIDATPVEPVDGSAGEGCTYVSGDYVVRNGNTCDSITISCPHGLGDASFAACSTMCPRDGDGTAFRCWEEPGADAWSGMVLISCLAPACQA